QAAADGRCTVQRHRRLENKISHAEAHGNVWEFSHLRRSDSSCSTVEVLRFMCVVQTYAMTRDRHQRCRDRGSERLKSSTPSHATNTIVSVKIGIKPCILIRSKRRSSASGGVKV
ncbi:unnamed protein product, partial [Ectocarpus sp. 12 AP-2014]